MRWLVVWPLLVACSYRAPVVPSDAADDVTDAAIDSDSMQVPVCFGTYLEICLIPPTEPLVLATADNLATDGTLCADTGATASGLCVVAATEISITSAIRAIGSSKPLVLLATTGGITIANTGSLDASSTRGANQGAGRATGTCNAGTIPIATGGGQGGSLGATGGNGGDGNGANNNGVAGAIVALATGEVRGGCSGANGAGGMGGIGGNGGGAMLLVATGAILVQGQVISNGAGGDPGNGGADGGGGGGSGGVIVFDGASLQIDGLVFANGGGGGEAANNNDNGNPGNDPAPPALGAGGSGGSIGGGGGGAGSLGLIGGGGASGNNGGGGGGGGGGAGIIRSVTVPAPGVGMSSPAITQ